MFDKTVMGKFYRNAKTPKDIPWHRDKPESFLIEVIKKRGKPGKALDVGCGTGSFSVYLAKHGYDVTALDMFPEALNMGRDQAKNEKVDVNWVQTDLFEWQTPQKFELILDSGCLHSLVGGNLKRYKEQLLSWLAPSGDYILGHWGKKHIFDWRPIGPRRRTRKKIEKFLAPELSEVLYEEFLATGIPFPFGPSVMGMSFLFKKNINY